MSVVWNREGICEEERDVHDNEIDEIYTTSFHQFPIYEILIYTLRKRAVFKPEHAKRQTVSLQMPERHCERGDCFEYTDEAVGLQD